MKKRSFIWALLLLALCVAAYMYWFFPEADQTLEVRFLDVGQGDCAIAQCGGETLLIDGGEPGQSQFVYSYLKNTMGLQKIDYIIATHPDSDHIGGISAALNACEAGVIYSSVTESDTKTFKSLLKYVEKQGKTITVPKAGDSFSLGSARVTFLGPIRQYEDDNSNSLVVRVDFNETSFLFMGDSEKDAEGDMLEKGKKLQATVLKVAHHGSSSSTSEAFLRAVQPEYAVISVGKNNKYGHPTEATLSALSQSGAKIYRTDKNGTICCVSDGKSVRFTCEKNQPVEETAVQTEQEDAQKQYIGNIKSKKFHSADCSGAAEMKAKNKVYFSTREEAIDAGYTPCKICEGK